MNQMWQKVIQQLLSVFTMKQDDFSLKIDHVHCSVRCFIEYISICHGSTKCYNHLQIAKLEGCTARRLGEHIRRMSLSLNWTGILRIKITVSSNSIPTMMP